MTTDTKPLTAEEFLREHLKPHHGFLPTAPDSAVKEFWLEFAEAYMQYRLGWGTAQVNQISEAVDILSNWVEVVKARKKVKL